MGASVGLLDAPQATCTLTHAHGAALLPSEQMAWGQEWRVKVWRKGPTDGSRPRAPVHLPRQSFGRAVRAALYAPNEPLLDYNMVIIFIMAVGTVALGGYWAGSRDVRK